MITWCAQRLSPAEFWRQTPRSYVAVMKGCARAANRDFELAMTIAHQTEAFARTKKLQGLSHYLPRDSDKGPVSPEVIYDAMLDLQASGMAMTIEIIDCAIPA